MGDAETSAEKKRASVVCPMLNSTNYTVWSIQMKVTLRVSKVWEAIDPGTNEAEKNDVATALLFQSIPETLILEVGDQVSPKEIWEAIKSRHLGEDSIKEARLQTLMSEFKRLKMYANMESNESQSNRDFNGEYRSRGRGGRFNNREKEVAESEAKDWKRKFENLAWTFPKLDETGALKELELESFDENVKLGLELAKIKLPIPKKTESCEDDLSRKGLAYYQVSGSPYITTPVKDYMVGRDRDDESSRRRVKKMLVFEDDDGGRKSTDVVEISDSDTEEISKKESDGMDTLEERSVGENNENDDEDDDVDEIISKEFGPSSIKCLMLTNANYAVWSMRMKIALKVNKDKSKESEKKLLASFEESKVEIASLKERIDGSDSSEEEDDDDSSVLGDFDIESMKNEMESTKESLAQAHNAAEAPSLKISDLLEEMKSVRNKLKSAIDAETTSKKAMDDLALALKEVATDCSQTKEKLVVAETELEAARLESREWKEKHEEVRKEAELLKNTSESLKNLAEESFLAWKGKESVFVSCIKRGEDEKNSLLDENNRLLEALVAAENLSKKAKEENHKVRDILKQAISEANVAKEAAGMARAENSKQEDALLDKEEELEFALREMERVNVNEAVANKNVKRLKKQVSEIEVAMEEKKHRSLSRQDSMQRDVIFDESKGWKWDSQGEENKKESGAFRLIFGELGNQGIREDNDVMEAVDVDQSTRVMGKNNVNEETAERRGKDDENNDEITTCLNVGLKQQIEDDEGQEEKLRRSTRQRTTPNCLDDYVLMIEFEVMINEESWGWSWNKVERKSLYESGGFIIGLREFGSKGIVRIETEENTRVMSENMENETVHEVEEENEGAGRESDEDDSDEEPQPQLRRSTRASVKPTRLNDYILLAKTECERLVIAINEEPWNFQEYSLFKVWVEACKEELCSIEKNKLWNLVDLLVGVKSIRLKWVFKTKRKTDGSIKHKARLMVKSCPDMKTAFFHGEMKEEVYVAVGSEEKVYKTEEMRDLIGVREVTRNDFKLKGENVGVSLKKA